MENINYMQLLSKEESEKIEKETDDFLLSLDSNIKQRLRSLVEVFQQQIECEHIWIDPNQYENDLPKDKLFCRLCSATKLTDEAKERRLEKWRKKFEINEE